MRYLNIPGLYNSGNNHWQTRWEQVYPDRFTRVQQADWDVPNKEQWVDRLDKAVKEIDTPTILVAHSLGCITAVHWAVTHYSPFIYGALLVAPADVENSDKAILKNFAPVPTEKLYLPTIMIASTNDPYCAMERAAKWAAYWGSRFVAIGNKGHINGDSDLHDWKEGQAVLWQLEGLVEANVI
jgi:predicted alpha/beta hydrolase family esterase